MRDGDLISVVVIVVVVIGRCLFRPEPRGPPFCGDDGIYSLMGGSGRVVTTDRAPGREAVRRVVRGSHHVVVRRVEIDEVLRLLRIRVLAGSLQGLALVLGVFLALPPAASTGGPAEEAAGHLADSLDPQRAVRCCWVLLASGPRREAGDASEVQSRSFPRDGLGILWYVIIVVVVLLWLGAVRTVRGRICLHGRRDCRGAARPVPVPR